MRQKIIFTLFACLSVIYRVTAQTAYADVSGQVQTADGQPAQFINVQLKNTSYGTVSDAEGKFSFKAPAGEYMLLVFSITAHKKEYPVILRPDTVNYFPKITILEKAQELEAVVITGTRTEKRFSDSPVLTKLIRDKEIRKAGAVSTIESLQDHIPGIVITPNAMGNNLRIKGLNSRYVLFLVDGERMVSEGAGGNINLSQLDVNSIKRIEMIDGASSVLYGSNAVGAVVNIITKEPYHAIETAVRQILESHNTLHTHIDLAATLKQFSANASVSRNSSDGFGGDGGVPYAARYEDYGANLKLKYKPTSRADFGLSGRFFSHETFNPSNTLNVVHSLSNNINAGMNGGFSTPGNKNTLRLSVNFNKYLDYGVLEKKNNEKELKNSASYISSRAVNTFRPDDTWELLGGLEHNHEENYATAILGSNPTVKKLDDLNLFTQIHCKIKKNLDAVGGARYTYNTQFGSALTPKISLMYKISGFTLRGGFGSAFRAPSIKELYYDFNHQGMFWIYGNPALKAEKGLYSSLSAEYTREAFNLSVSGYHNRIGNKITQYDIINSAGANEKHYKNISSATLQGFDVNAAYLLFNQLYLKGSYSFCDAQDNATGLQLESNVKHSATFSSTWNGHLFKSPFSLQLAGRINSPILYQAMITDVNGNLIAQKKQSKSYSIWKIVFVKPFSWRKNVFELTLKADNIFNFKDTAFINPGRQYLIGLHYNFKS